MKIYPLHVYAQKINCKKYTQNSSVSFSGKIPRKEITAVSDEYVKKTHEAKNRAEFYTIASAYLKDGLLPILDNKRSKNVLSFRQKLIDTVAPDVELSFDPMLMLCQEDVKHISLKGERKRFAAIAKNVKNITKEWSDK